MADIQRPRPLRSPGGVFLVACILASAFAWFTAHAWEDYYITYRVSKNFATGHGLVFNIGERLHVFTSPLGVLLPALASLLTGNSSDDAALWLFRAMSIGAFAGAATLVFTTTQRLGWHPWASALLAAWLISDNKSLDFSINGMETGLLLLFLGYALWSLLAANRRRWLHLGLAWGGLMWTRPDGFIYIGAMSLGVLIFGSLKSSGRTRKEWLQTLLLAAAVCTVVYLPWFIGSWVYYGTPVPHTIIAKSNAAGALGAKTIGGALLTLIKLPLTCWSGAMQIDTAFAPSNYIYGGWPHFLLVIIRCVAALGTLLWLLPTLRWEARMASFACLLLMAYLGYYPNCPFSWYLPGPAWLALFAFGGGLSQLLESSARGARWLRVPAGAAAILFLGIGCWLTVQSARQLRLEQSVVDGGNRRAIGQWLKANAAPGDRVFLECLGYIGYYSGLKTYDWPGLSSPEVVQATREVGYKWDKIISRLQPEWVVLRPGEAIHICGSDPALLNSRYKLARVFDVTGALGRSKVFGRGVLAFDSVFMIYRRTGQEIQPPGTTPPDGPGVAPLLADSLEEAIFYSQKSLEIHPDSADAHNNLGNALLKKGRLDEALAHYRTALELDAGSAECRYNLGLALQQTGRLDEAMAHFQKALEVDPGYAEAHNNLGDALLQKGQMEKALEHFEKALELNPISAEALNNLALVLAASNKAELRDGARAIALAQQADRLTGGSNTSVLATLAAALAESGDFFGASETAQRALRLAEMQGNPALADLLREHVRLYQRAQPLRFGR